LICYYTQFYYIGNTFSLVVFVFGRLSYVFHEGYHRKERLERTQRESLIRKRPWFHETLQDAKGHAVDESLV
jgi:hypothetical protein